VRKSFFPTVLQSGSQLIKLLFARGFLYPEDGGNTFLRDVNSYKGPHGAASRKTAIFIVNAEKTSNPAFLNKCPQLYSCTTLFLEAEE
jgi:hypothetical protein